MRVSPMRLSLSLLLLLLLGPAVTASRQRLEKSEQEVDEGVVKQAEQEEEQRKVHRILVDTEYAESLTRQQVATADLPRNAAQRRDKEHAGHDHGIERDLYYGYYGYNNYYRQSAYKSHKKHKSKHYPYYPVHSYAHAGGNYGKDGGTDDYKGYDVDYGYKGKQGTKGKGIGTWHDDSTADDDSFKEGKGKGKGFFWAHDDDGHTQNDDSTKGTKGKGKGFFWGNKDKDHKTKGKGKGKGVIWSQRKPAPTHHGGVQPPVTQPPGASPAPEAPFTPAPVVAPFVDPPVGTDPTTPAPVGEEPVISPVLPPVPPETEEPTPFDAGDEPTEATGGASADPTPSTFSPTAL